MRTIVCRGSINGFDWKIDISNCRPLMIGGSTDSLCINFNGTIS